jgi:integrase/recombinase XerD
MSALPNKYELLDEGLVNVNESAKKLLTNPLIDKDVWRTIEDLGLEINEHHRILTINFNSVQQDWLKLLVKLYVLIASQRKTPIGSISNILSCLKNFSSFIADKNIFRFSQINDRVFDEFDYYLHSQQISKRGMYAYYTILKNFFDLCRDEGWIEVSTYWFEGKFKKFQIKRDEIEYIPEEVWQQLSEHLHHLPEPLQRMVLIIRATGLRIGELLNLPLDCLRQREKQWRLRLLTEKYEIKDEIPICEELVTVIKEQQKYIRQQFGDSYNKLCNGHYSIAIKNGYRPAPKVMNAQTFNVRLNKLAAKYNICDKEGKVWQFRSHQFRKTVATVMTNAGVRDLIIQKYLRHRSPEMQEYYKHLLKEVLGDEYQELMKDSSYVDSTGKLVAQHQPQNPITELVRRKMYQITTQYGECHRPILKSPCQTVNACWQCEHWLTSTDDLSALKDDLQRVEIELEIAARLGMVIQNQRLTLDQKRLITRIEGLEKIDGTY